MKRQSALAAATAFLLAGALPGRALIQEEGGGILYGKHPAFMVKAPKGWMFDNESGQDTGLFAVFYLKGSTWANSKVVAYVQTHPITDAIRNPADLAAKTVADFKRNGSPNSKSADQPAIRLANGREAIVVHFTGDQWGNFEAVAYIAEEGWIHYFVLNSRTEEDFKKFRPALEEFVKNYQLIGKVDIKDLTKSQAGKKDGREEEPGGKEKPATDPKAKSGSK
jgi:hypothetical protein